MRDLSPAKEHALRVVITGTHGSGKSTLITDFATLHPEWTILPDPYELLDDAADASGASAFFLQLCLASERLLEPSDIPVLAERGPLDFLAYLYALDALGRDGASAGLLSEVELLTAQAMADVDLLVLLPLNEVDAIAIGAEEDLELRGAMDRSLLELADDSELVGTSRVIEVTGSRQQRLSRMECEIAKVVGSCR